MSYYPNSIMPETRKSDSPDASSFTDSRTISSDKYNKHDAEIRAIQEYIGTTINNDGLTGRLNSVISRLNFISDPTTGVSVSSATMTSGDRILIPETMQTARLTASITSSDAKITVSSTKGFPDSGYLTLLASTQIVFDEQTQVFSFPDRGTNVEWVHYQWKNETQFLGCTRGYLNTKPTYAYASTSSDVSNKNDKDYSPSMATATPPITDSYLPRGLTRRIPGWRKKTAYFVPALGWSGDLVEISFKLMRRASSIRLSSLNPAQSQFITAAGTLAYLIEPNIYGLVSADPVAEAAGRLTWPETSGIIMTQAAIQGNTVVVKIAAAGDYEASYLNSQVFGGLMSLIPSYDISAAPIEFNDAISPSPNYKANISFWSKNNALYPDGSMLVYDGNASYALVLFPVIPPDDLIEMKNVPTGG